MTFPAAVQACGLQPIADKVVAGERITDADALQLFHCPDIIAIGAIANVVRERLHGDVSWFNRNLHINATNVCEATCIFCSFSRMKTGDPNAYTMTLAEAVGRVAALRDAFLTEVHIVNGLNPDVPFSYYFDLLRGLKEERPDLHIKGFTAVEIHYFSEKFGLSHAEVLDQLRDAGFESMPGGGAEIFADRARRKLCADKVDSQGWLDIHQLAHEKGFRTNATMLFGSIETLEERVDHLRRLRDLQDKTGGFQTFIPLKFHNENNRLRNVAETTGLDCWKTLAIGRIYLDNFAHVKAYWPMMGTPVAQLSQAFGVSDLDGTVREERIYHMAGATTPNQLTRAELIELIHRADRLALERDTLYHVVAQTPALVDTKEGCPPLRIGSVGYLNAWPLTATLASSVHSVREDVPSVVAELLANDEVDVALVPVAAILTDGDWRIVPGMGIGADGPVASVLLVAQTPPEQWTEVLLDGESRTSAVLAQLLCSDGPLSERVGEFSFRTVDRGTAMGMAGGTTAALVIGDTARQVPEHLVERFDLAALWKQWTGLPFVFAVWAGRPSLDARIGTDLRRAAAAGRGAIATEFAGEDRAYLENNLRYELDDRALMGLRRFAALGHKAGFFAHRMVELLAPAQLHQSSPHPLTSLIRDASDLQRRRRQQVISWQLCGSGTRAELTGDLLAQLKVCTATERVAKLAEVELAGHTMAALRAAGLTHISLDDGGPLLTDPLRRALTEEAVHAGLIVEGCAHFGRGETDAERLAHLHALTEVGAVRVTVRTAGWRGPHTEGQATAADWLRIACWTRLHTELELIMPWRTEGLAVMQVGLQAAVDGIEPMPASNTWEAEAFKLDQALRDAGFTPNRVGMDTPQPSARVLRRHRPQPKRADLR